jgi:hypothetical protein
LSLSRDDGLLYAGEVRLNGEQEGRYYRVDFPSITNSAGQMYRLTLHAPEATVENPVVTRSVGGDRLGGTLRLNEFARPGNLEIYTYGRGFPGRWWFAAVGEQILPDLFRLRLQQYKPALFKGSVFSGFLILFLGLTFSFLVLSRPAGISLTKALGWALVALTAGFLVWQINSGRVQPPLLIRPTRLAAAEITPAVAPPIAPPPGESRVIQDLASSLWTAERLPQARLATTELVEVLPAIRVPADAALNYPLTLPPGGRLRIGFAAVGDGQLEAKVMYGDQVLAETKSIAEAEVGTIHWFDVDLTGLAEQTGILRLVTDSDGRPPLAHSEPAADTPQGLWIMPQIVTDAGWLLPDPLPDEVKVRPAGYRFGEVVELVGYSFDPEVPQPGETLAVTLYWRLVRRDVATQRLYPTTFVHLLDAEGQILGQHDAPPVEGVYPVANWQPGMIVADRHEVQLPSDAMLDGAQLAIGFYEPGSLERWPVTDVNGVAQPDGRAIFSLE